MSKFRSLDNLLFSLKVNQHMDKEPLIPLKSTNTVAALPQKLPKTSSNVVNIGNNNGQFHVKLYKNYARKTKVGGGKNIKCKWKKRMSFPKVTVTGKIDCDKSVRNVRSFFKKSVKQDVTVLLNEEYLYYDQCNHNRTEEVRNC